jgi:signal transduction histidine kinase
LRPEALIKTPLDDLLEQLVEALTSRMEIKAETDIQPVPDLPPKVHINIYRVAQEALNNIIKHTEASQLSLRLVASPPYSSAAAEAWQGQIELCIRDNGSGFDPGETTPESLGMGIMRERVREIGGKLSIESQPGEGTEVVLVWEDS